MRTGEEHRPCPKRGTERISTGFLMPLLDENGTPKEKLPPCPNCMEDELGVINPLFVMCYVCGWTFDCDGDRK